MIKVKNWDSIIDILDKVKKSDKKKNIIFFPVWNSILHSKSSLIILKNKIPNLYIVTNDIASKNIIESLEINFSIEKTNQNENSNKNINLLEYNYTFSEYLIYLLKKYYEEFINFIIWWKKKQLKSKIKNIRVNKLIKW
jgi:hypothetical protein